MIKDKLYSRESKEPKGCNSNRKGMEKVNGGIIGIWQGGTIAGRNRSQRGGKTKDSVQ